MHSGKQLRYLAEKSVFLFLRRSYRQRGEVRNLIFLYVFNLTINVQHSCILTHHFCH